MKYKFKEHLQELRRVRVGTYRESAQGLFLDRNERVVPFEKETIERLYQRLSKSAINLYPDVGRFYRKLSQWLDISEDRIYVTEGVSGAIKSLVETIAEPGDNIIFPTPTFALYPVYCEMFRVEPRTVEYTKNYQLDKDRVLSLVDDRSSIVFLPNPNVPIEGVLDLEAVGAIAEYCSKKNCFVAVDEVYYPFGGPTAVSLIDEFDNLFVMRSCSKAFGLAGIRVGYLLGKSENIEYVSKTRTGYESNTVSMEIASFFIDNYDLVENYIQSVKKGLAYLKEELDKLGLQYNGGNASNFIYINLGDEEKVTEVVEKLKTVNIYIRGGWPEPFATGIAVTGAPKVVMQKFVKELIGIL